MPIGTDIPAQRAPAVVSTFESPNVLEAVSTGATTRLTTIINTNSAVTEELGKAILGAHAIFEGLTITTSGLVMTFAAGKAYVGGMIVKAQTTYTLPANQSNVWVWLKQDGTFTHTTTSTQPSGENMLVAHAVTGASSITSSDQDGVYRWRNGLLERTTADTDVPTDSPASTLRVATKTAGGSFLWTGTEHVRMVPEGDSPRWQEVSFAFGALFAGALTKTVDVLTLPAGSIVHAVLLDVTTGLAGGAISSVSVDVGTAGTPTKYISGANGASVARTLSSTVQTNATSEAVKLKVTVVGANLDVLTSGALKVRFLLSNP